MIYDCFTFFNELDILDIRLHELDACVDTFVLIEATVTFTNKKKRLYFQENKQRFKQFLPKIVQVIVDDSPNVFGNPWLIEEYQFNAITRGLKNVKGNDTVLLSCVDEIPKAETLMLSTDTPGKNKVYLQKRTFYYLNYALEKQVPAQGTNMFTYKNLMSYKSPYIARYSPADRYIPNGGWHFSYTGSVNQIRDTIMSYSHQEFNNPKYNTPEKIRSAVISGQDLFHKGYTFTRMPYTFLPTFVQEHKQEYKQLLLDPEKSFASFIALIVFLLYILDRMRNSTRMIRNILRIKLLPLKKYYQISLFSY